MMFIRRTTIPHKVTTAASAERSVESTEWRPLGHCSTAAAQHEAAILPTVEPGFVIFREFLQRTAHLFVGQKPGKSSAALDLVDQVNWFVSHGHRQRFTRQLPRSPKPTLFFDRGFHPVWDRNGGAEG